MGWVRQYRQELEQWRQLVEVGTIAEQFVKTHGVTPGGAQQLQHRLAETGTLPRTQQLSAELLQFVTEEGAKAKAGERLVGSSEVIESIFGKWKRLEGDQARSGLTGLVLALGAHRLPHHGSRHQSRRSKAYRRKRSSRGVAKSSEKPCKRRVARSLLHRAKRNKNRISSSSPHKKIFVLPPGGQGGPPGRGVPPGEWPGFLDSVGEWLS